MKKALIQMNLAVLLWGFTGVLGRAISLSASVLVWYRMFLTVVILGIIITYRKEWKRADRNDTRKIIFIGLLYAVHWVAFYASIKYANASIAMVCLATASVFTAFLHPIMSRGKFNAIELTLSVIAVLGVLIIYLFQDEQASDNMMNWRLGLLLGVFASILSAIFTVLNKPLAERYPARTLVFYEMLTGLSILTLLSPFYIYYYPSEPILPQKFDYLWLFILSYCCTVWGQSLAMAALKRLSPFTVTLSVNLEPIYGIILAFLIFQENKELSNGFYYGMGLIFISIALQVVYIIKANRRAPIMPL